MNNPDSTVLIGFFHCFEFLLLKRSVSSIQSMLRVLGFWRTFKTAQMLFL